jgi:hypothetical protein
MRGQEKFNRFAGRFPHPHVPFFDRPHWTRRRFFELLGGGVTGSLLASSQAAVTQNKARNVVFVLLLGGASQVDTFDFKEVSGFSPLDKLKPDTINGIRWPVGLLPKMAVQLPNLAIVRSVRAWALEHGLSQTWSQIGRNPAGVLGTVAPHIGSIVAIEKEPERKPNQVFPPFLAINSPGAVGSGYLPVTYAPFKTLPGGLSNTSIPEGAALSNERWALLHELDDPLRTNSPLGARVEDHETFYRAARGLMYNPAVDKAFQMAAADRQRYGSSSFGDACLIARQALDANQGTRFIQITSGGWDMHNDIYSNSNMSLFGNGKMLDDGFSALLADLKSSGLLNETLIVMMGEFGRTVGPLSPQGGRDHYAQQFCVFAGAGVRGGRTIGATNASGSEIVDYGWSRQRYVRAEDIEATIYSALGIDWTTVRRDDPFNRGFEYVPFSGDDVYGPINELWG